MSPAAGAWEVLERAPRAIEEAYTAYRNGEEVSRTCRVMLATPAYNPPCLEFLQARDNVTRDLLDNGIDVTVVTSPGDSLVMRGRHALMHEFLKSTATHMMCWDVDIEPLDATVVRRMVLTGHPIVAGACPYRGDTGRVVCTLLPEDRARGRIDTDGTGCVRVSEVGTGFMLLTRGAIVHMCETHPELLYWSDMPSWYGEPMWALFDTKVVDRRFLSEDYMFCKIARDLGLGVMVYVPFEARHWGRQGYRAQCMTAWGMRDGQ